jgi:hypothetical protein
MKISPLEQSDFVLAFWLEDECEFQGGRCSNAYVNLFFFFEISEYVKFSNKTKSEYVNPYYWH